MSGAGIVFDLVGNDRSASSALSGVQEAGKTAAKGIAAAFAGLALKDAFDMGNAAEDTLAVFTAGLGQTPEVAKKAGDLAGKLYNEGWGTGLEDMTGAISGVGAQMVDLSKTGEPELAKLATGASSIAKVMGVDVVDVTRAAGNMMKNGLAKDGQEALDIIATGAQNGANNAGDLLDTLGEYSDSFANIGLDGKDALGMMKAAMDGGAFSTDIAADSVREFGTRVLDGSAEAGGAFKTLGLDSKKMTAAVAEGGPAAKEAMETIMTALSKTTDPLKREQAGVALFGGMWEDAGSKMVLSMNPAATSIGDVAGATEKMGDTLHNTSSTKVAEITRTFDGWMQSATDLPGPLGTVAGAAMAIGPTVLTMGASIVTAAGALSNMGLVTKLAAAGQWLLNAALSANPIGLVIIAVAALTAGIIWAWNNVGWFRDFVIAAWELIKDATGKVRDFFVAAWTKAKETFRTVVDWIKTKWSGFVSWIQTMITNIGGFFSGLWNGVKSVVGTVVDWIKARWESFKTALKTVIDKIGGFFSGMWNGIKSVVQGVVNWIKGRWDGFKTSIKSIIDKIGGFFSGMWNGIKAVVQGVVDRVVEIWTGIKARIEAVTQAIGYIFSAAWQGIKNTLAPVIAGIVGAFETMKSTIDGIFTWIERRASTNITLPSVNLGGITPHATGGVIMPRRGGQPILAGEAGEPEAVVPLSKWDAMTSGNGGGGGGTTVHVHVSGAMVANQDQLARLVVDSVAGARRRNAIPKGHI